jgi:thiamine-monophosphate kinase
LVKGIGDDCATVRIGGRQLLTVDSFVEGVHFRKEWSKPSDAGWKALAANVSDIAAVGGRPVAALVALELPADTKVPWLKSFYGGMLSCARRYGLSIAGGNISRGERFGAHITVAGEAPVRPVGRSGARPGDIVAVTGKLGGASAGLLLLARGVRSGPAVRRHLHPEPSLRAGQVLARYASAMADISDGLARDAGHIAEESGVKVVIVPGAVPVHPAARALAFEKPKSVREILPRYWLGILATQLAVGSGEEYELVAAVPRRRFGAALRALSRTGITLTAVGEVRRGRGVALPGHPGPLPGFDHFGVARYGFPEGRSARA